MNTFNYVCLSLLSVTYICVFVLYFYFTRSEKLSHMKLSILVKSCLYLCYNLTLMTYDEPTPMFKLIAAIFDNKATISFSVFMYFVFRVLVLYIIYTEIYFCITYIDSLNAKSEQIKFYYYIPPLVMFVVGIIIHDDLHDLMMYMLLVSLFLTLVFSVVNMCLVAKRDFVEKGIKKLFVIGLWVIYAGFLCADWGVSFAYFYNYNRGAIGKLLPKLHFLFSIAAFAVQVGLVWYSKDLLQGDKGDIQLDGMARLTTGKDDTTQE